MIQANRPRRLFPPRSMRCHSWCFGGVGCRWSNANAFLDRHARGDWGEVDAEDKQANQDALVHGERLLSAYRTSLDVRIWVITEADRSVTTILLPEEY